MIDIQSPYLFSQYPDLKIEFILGELLETGLDPDDVIINALGIFKRRYDKDILSGEVREYKTGKRQFLSIDINRNGIYDLLPKGLFHQPHNRSNNLSARQAIEELKVQKHIEKESRLFFLPFEQELYRLALLLETEERRSIFDVQNVLKNEVFIDFWGIPDIFNTHQMCNLLYLLPLAGFIAGNAWLTRLCFECILNDRVEIHESSPVNHQFSVPDQLRLNNIFLGVDFTIETNYREVARSMEISIFPSIREDIVSYLDGGPRQKMLNFLADYFLPFENDVSIHIMADEMFTLAEESFHSRLGITTNI